MGDIRRYKGSGKRVVKPFVREFERGDDNEGEERKRREGGRFGGAKGVKMVLDTVKFAGNAPDAFRRDKSTGRELQGVCFIGSVSNRDTSAVTYDGVEGIGDGFVIYAAGDKMMVVVRNTLCKRSSTQMRSSKESNGGRPAGIISVENNKFDEVSFRVGNGATVEQGRRVVLFSGQERSMCSGDDAQPGVLGDGESKTVRMNRVELERRENFFVTGVGAIVET
jgi:hypothetical protein